MGFAQAARSGEIFNPLRKCGYRVVDFATRSRSRSAAPRFAAFRREWVAAQQFWLQPFAKCIVVQRIAGSRAGPERGAGQFGEGLRYSRCWLRDADQGAKKRTYDYDSAYMAVLPVGAGARTQHTNYALPMSRGATQAMICFSACDPANIAVASPHSDSHLFIGCGRLRISQRGQQI